MINGMILILILLIFRSLMAMSLDVPLMVCIYISTYLLCQYHVSLKELMQQGICTPEFYGDLVYTFKIIIGNPNFSNLFKRIVNHFKRAWYTLDSMRQTACLVFNAITVEGYAALFSCTAVVQVSDSMTALM